MAVAGQESELVQVVVLLAAGVIGVPIFRRLGLGSVLGYFAAGLIIGPFGLGLFSDPALILHTAEFGVIMLLFVIGLEMEPARLWRLRRQIFGLGALQVGLCGALLTGAGVLYGLEPAIAFVAAMGFVLSSTAVVMQMLNERGETSTAEGQKAVSILLVEDLAIVPLLAAVAVLAPSAPDGGISRSAEIAIAAACLAGLIIAGRYLLNPMFRILASAGAREVMTAAALLVVLGAALLMEIGGLSMALGAFVAGVLLSESSFRHQLESDIEPFRGLLLGLFFLAVGMSLDLGVIARNWAVVAIAVIAFTVVKSFGIYVAARVFGATNREAVHRIALFAQGGEFAFVLYSAAFDVGIFDAETNAIFTAVVILSMALTPINAIAIERLMPAPRAPSLEGIDKPDGLEGQVLIVGFGRFAQVVSQALLARGFDVSIIENNVEQIRAASSFGFKVYYGDGTRLATLRASGAETARAVLVCTDDRETTTRIVDLVTSEFPLAKLLVRSYDRGHSIELSRKRVDFEVRETLGSAMLMGEAALVELGVPHEEVEEIMEDVRRRDEERLQLQFAGGLRAGADLIRGNEPVPTPLTKPRREGRIIEAQDEPADAAS